MIRIMPEDTPLYANNTTRLMAYLVLIQQNIATGKESVVCRQAGKRVFVFRSFLP